MFDYFLFNYPWRRWLVKLCPYLPKRLQNKLAEALLPLDMPMRFEWMKKDRRKR
jgi:hypothetical protein